MSVIFNFANVAVLFTVGFVVFPIRLLEFSPVLLLISQIYTIYGVGLCLVSINDFLF